MYGPVEVYAAELGALVELLDACGLVGGVCLAPVCPVVGVVLRAVDVDVHLVAAVEVELAQAVLVAPWAAVESLDAPAEGHVGPVGNLANLEFSLRHHLQQGLHAIVQSAVVGTHDGGTFRRYLQEIALGVRRHGFLVAPHGLVARHAQVQFEGSLFGALGGSLGYGGEDMLRYGRRRHHLPLRRHVAERLLRGHVVGDGVDEAHLGADGGGSHTNKCGKEKCFLHSHWILLQKYIFLP